MPDQPDPRPPFSDGPDPELRYRSLVEQLPAVVFVDVVDPEFRTVFITSGIEDMTGYPPEAFYDDSELFNSLIHPEDVEPFLREWRTAVEENRSYEASYRLRRRDGSIVWLEDHAAPIFAEDGRLTGWQGVMFDITARHEAGQALATSEARYRTLVEQLPVVVYAVENTLHPTTIYISPNALDVIGVSSETFSTTPFPEFVHEDDRARVWKVWAAALETSSRFEAEYRIRRSDDSIIWVHDTCMLVHVPGAEPFWQGVMVDVTTENLAEENLRASEDRYRTLVEQLPVVVYVDSDEVPSRSLYVSPNAGSVLGTPADAYRQLGAGWVDQIHHDDRRRFDLEWTAAVDLGVTFDSEYRFVGPGGRVTWVHDRSWPVTAADGDRHWQGILVDITAQREVEAELEAAQARYRALVEHIPAVVYEMDDDDERRTLYVSPHIEQLLGYSRQEWLDQPDIWIELLHPDDREIELEAHDRLSASGEAWSREYRLIAADGREVWVRDQARLVFDSEGRPLTWQGVLFDISAQKEAEEHLVAVNDVLEMRVLERTVALEEANELMGMEVEERRRAERELRVAEARFRRLVEDMPAVVYTWEPPENDVPRLYVSPGIERTLGYTPEEWTTTPGLWLSRVHPQDRERVRAASVHSGETGEPFDQEYRYLAKDGRVVWVIDRATLLRRDESGSLDLFQGVMVDVTARKEAERKAEEAESRFRDLIDAGPAMAYAYHREDDPPRLVLDYLSPHMAELVGQETEVFFQDPDAWFRLVHPDDLAEVLAHARRTEETGKPWDLRYRMLGVQGLRWVHDQGHTVEWDERGRPLRFTGAIWDVTAEVEERRALEERAALLHDVFAGLPALVWTEVADLETGRSTFPLIEGDTSIYGYTAAELQQGWEGVPRLVHPDDRERVDAGSALAHRSPEGLWRDEYRTLRRDGSVGWVHGRARRVTPAGASPAIWHGVTVDVTTRHTGLAGLTEEEPAADREPANTDLA